MLSRQVHEAILNGDAPKLQTLVRNEGFRPDYITVAPLVSLFSKWMALTVNHIDVKDTLKVCLEAGFDIDTPLVEESTILGFITLLDFDGSILDVVLPYNPQINHQNRDGKTPLHYACTHYYLKAIEKLLDAGADPTICDKDNLSPLDLTYHQVQRLMDELATQKLATAMNCFHAFVRRFPELELKTVRTNVPPEVLAKFTPQQQKQLYGCMKVKDAAFNLGLLEAIV